MGWVIEVRHPQSSILPAPWLRTAAESLGEPHQVMRDEHQRVTAAAWGFESEEAAKNMANDLVWKIPDAVVEVNPLRPVQAEVRSEPARAPAAAAAAPVDPTHVASLVYASARLGAAEGVRDVPMRLPAAPAVQPTADSSLFWFAAGITIGVGLGFLLEAARRR